MQIEGWTCKDVGTVTFQGYAPKTVQTQLEEACRQPHQGGLPFTGLDLASILIVSAVLLVLGPLLRRFGKV